MARGYPPPDLKALFERVAGLNQQFRGVAAFNEQFKDIGRQFRAIVPPLPTYRPNAEFVAIWNFFEELQKRDPEAARLLGGLTPRELHQLRRVLRLPPKPRGRPPGKRQRDIEIALDALAAGEPVTGRDRRKYVRRLSRKGWGN